MKLRNIFTVLAAALALATGCQKDGLNLLSEVQVSSSYVAIPQIGGSKTIMVTATDSWSISEMPQWLTISPASGSAGETAVTFSAENTLDGRNCDLNLVCGGKTQIIKVIQGLAVVAPATCSEIIAGPDSKTYRVTGVCTAIANTSYGNWYLNDGTGEIYIYGTVNGSGKYDWASFNIEVGDEVTVEGPKTTYNGTVELVDALFVSVNKSLIKVDSLSIADKKIDIVPIEGAEVVANLTCKGNGISVDIPAAAQSWVSITGIDTGAGKAYLKVAPNAGGDRSTVLTFVTKDSKKSYTSEVTLAQKGAILEVSIAEYLAAAEDDTQYRISGIITSVAQDSEKYGANLYIQDATGKVYIYGTVGEDGKVKTLESFGAKEGDIIEFVGKRSSYNSTPQMAKGQFQWYKTVTPMNAADVAALADDDKKDPKNYIMLTGKVTDGSSISGHKFDLKTYGNFDLVDESGSVYVYGVSTGWNGETKKFESLGVKEGDTITIVAYKTSYGDLVEAVGMYVSHKSAQHGDNLVFTADVLPTAYADAAEVTVSGTTFIANQVANYGNGIQFKKEVGYVINKTAFTKKIKKVTCVPFEGKTWYKDNISVLGGSAADALEAVSASDDQNLVYDFSGKNCTFLKIANASGYAYYLESITIEFE